MSGLISARITSAAPRLHPVIESGIISRPAHGLARILPGSRLFTQGATEVARLAELSADDAAARRHGRDTVVDALLALCEPNPSAPSPLRVPGLGVTGVGVADRVERLLFPLNPARARLAQAAAARALLLGPTMMAVLIFTQSPLCVPVMI